MVRVLRYALPATAVLLIGLAIAWPQFIGGGAGLIAPMLAPGQIEGGDVMRMHNPRYVGQTGDAEPFEVTAASASMDPAQPNRIHLDQLVGGHRDRGHAAASACWRVPASTIARSEDVDLAGGIELTTSDGYRFETPSAHGQPGARPGGRAGADRRVGSERHHRGRSASSFATAATCCGSTGASGLRCNPRSDVRS